jgi:hypothetical protein
LTKTVTVTADNWMSFEHRLSLPRYLVDAALLELDPEAELAAAECEAAFASDLVKHAAELAENPEYDSAGVWQTGEEPYRAEAQAAQQRVKRLQERFKAQQASLRRHEARHRRTAQRPVHHERHRRRSHGGKTIRCGSRRVGAGSRAGPDDEGELPGDIVAPLPTGGRP